LAWLNPNDNFDLFEGDIILGKEDIRINDQNGIVLKSVHPFYHWPNGIVPYTLDKIFDNKEVQKIQNAMKEIESKSCIKFRQFDPSKDENYLAIVTFPSRCSSLVGLDPSEQPGQLLTLGEGCVKHGTIIHELMHALGFYHEQSRADRDKYVEIHWENIMPHGRHNFEKAYYIDDYGTPYDYCSIMHYPSYIFSKNGKDTITPKSNNPECRIGQRQMSDLDIERINLVYNCYKDDSSQEFSYEESEEVIEESEEVIEESEEVIDGCEDQDPSWCKIYLHLCQKFTGMMKFKCKESCNFC